LPTETKRRLIFAAIASPIVYTNCIGPGYHNNLWSVSTS